MLLHGCEGWNERQGMPWTHQSITWPRRKQTTMHDHPQSSSKCNLSDTKRHWKVSTVSLQAEMFVPGVCLEFKTSIILKQLQL